MMQKMKIAVSSFQSNTMQKDAACSSMQLEREQGRFCILHPKYCWALSMKIPFQGFRRRVQLDAGMIDDISWLVEPKMPVS